MRKSLLLALVLASGAALAQPYPSRPVKLVVPFPAGSATDQIARVLGEELQEALKQPFVVDNKAGAQGAIAAAEVAKAAPDGYTLMVTTNTPQAANVSLFKKLNYDPVKDFAPIARLGTISFMLMVCADHPAKDFKQFLAHARSNPGKLSGGYGSAGSQVSQAMLRSMAKIDFVDVPYKGLPQAIADVLGGSITSPSPTSPTRWRSKKALLHRVPVASAVETLEALNLPPTEFARWVPFDSGRSFEVAGVRVHPFPVPHDAANPVGFLLEGNGARVGVVTDLGHATTLVAERLRGCHVVMVEANHDDRLLRDGPYPWHLKQRIGGRMGHLSNDEAAALLAEAVGDDCRAVVLAHLSEKNNDARIARSTVADRLARAGRRRFTMRVAERTRPTPPVEI